jgi:hypothetical protein
MKKLILSFCLFLGFIFVSNSHVQAQAFQEGDMVVNAGIGLGSTYNWAGSLGVPLGGGLEYGISNLEVGTLGIGGDFGFVSGSGLTIFYMGGRGTYHLNELLNVEDEHLDIYGGLGIYYRNFSYNGVGTFGSGIIGTFHLGSRYYFSDNVGAYAELGNNWGWLNVGVAVKL